MAVATVAAGILPAVAGGIPAARLSTLIPHPATSLSRNDAIEMGSEGRWPAVSGGPPDTFVHFFNPPFRGLEMRVLEFSPGRRKQPAGRRRSPRKGMVPAQTPRLDLPAGRQKSGRYGSQQWLPLRRRARMRPGENLCATRRHARYFNVTRDGDKNLKSTPPRPSPQRGEGEL